MFPLLEHSRPSRIHQPYVFELAYHQCQMVWVEPDQPHGYVEIAPIDELLQWLERFDVEYATGYASVVWWDENRRRGEHYAYLVLYDLPTATMYRLMFT